VLLEVHKSDHRFSVSLRVYGALVKHESFVRRRRWPALIFVKILDIRGKGKTESYGFKPSHNASRYETIEVKKHQRDRAAK
jgi:hypothetical protein